MAKIARLQALMNGVKESRKGRTAWTQSSSTSTCGRPASRPCLAQLVVCLPPEDTAEKELPLTSTGGSHLKSFSVEYRVTDFVPFR